MSYGCCRFRDQICWTKTSVELSLCSSLSPYFLLPGHPSNNFFTFLNCSTFMHMSEQPQNRIRDFTSHFSELISNKGYTTCYHQLGPTMNESFSVMVRPSCYCGPLCCHKRPPKPESISWPISLQVGLSFYQGVWCTKILLMVKRRTKNEPRLAVPSCHGRR